MVIYGGGIAVGQNGLQKKTLNQSRPVLDYFCITRTNVTEGLFQYIIQIYILNYLRCGVLYCLFFAANINAPSLCCTLQSNFNLNNKIIIFKHSIG